MKFKMLKEIVSCRKGRL